MPTRKQKLRVRRDSSLVSIDAGRPASTPTRKASAAFASGSTICRQPFFANETQAIQGHTKHRNTAADMIASLDGGDLPEDSEVKALFTGEVTITSQQAGSEWLAFTTDDNTDALRQYRITLEEGQFTIHDITAKICRALITS